MCWFRIGSILSTIDANGNFAGGRTKFLIQTAVSAYPHVFFGNAHLEIDEISYEKKCKKHTPADLFSVSVFLIHAR